MISSVILANGAPPPGPGPFGKDASRNIKAFHALEEEKTERRKKRKKNNKGPQKFLILLFLIIIIGIFGYFLNGGY